MHRKALEELGAWKRLPQRKPLLLRGARRVGKTWLVQSFAQEHFAGRFHYLDFNATPTLRDIFRASPAPEPMFDALAAHTGRPVAAGDLLIFDGIEFSPEVISTLLRLTEHRRDLFLLVTGTYLDRPSSEPPSSSPEAVDELTLEPLSFAEFLLAQGETGLADCLRNWSMLEPLPRILFEPLSTKLQHYLTVGGMPEAAAAWCEAQNLTLARRNQQDILDAFRLDMLIRSNAVNAPKVRRVWESLPKQQAQGNHRFLFSDVEPRSNARKYGDALARLVDAQMVRRLPRIRHPTLPLSVGEEPGAFLAYFVDVGLFTRLTGLDPVLLQDARNLFLALQKAVAENYVLQSLRPQFGDALGFWSSVKPRTKVDFLVSVDDRIVPIEVVTSAKGRSSNLRVFLKQYGEECPLRVRFSLENLGFRDGLLSIPLFLADEALRLMRLALAQIDAA